MWIVAKTKGNQEHRALQNLENQGFKVYLPQIISKKYLNTSWKDQNELLFPGYIFVNIDSTTNKMHKINNTFGVSKLLTDPESGLPAVLSEQSIIEIKNNLNKAININNLSIGDNVIYTRGTLSNISGKITELSGKSRIKLLISMLNMQREIIVNSRYIQRIYSS